MIIEKIKYVINYILIKLVSFKNKILIKPFVLVKSYNLVKQIIKKFINLTKYTHNLLTLLNIIITSF